MKKMLLGCAFVLLSVSVSFGETIKIAYFSTYPHISYDQKTKKISGALYEFIQEHIAPAMGDTFVWDKSPSPVPRQFAGLKSNKIDAAALLIYSPERAKMFRYTKKPYHKGYSGIAVASDNPLSKITKVDDILGMKIGYAKKTFLSPFMRDKRIQFDLIGNANFLEVNMKKLLKGRIDAAYSPDYAGLLYVIKTMNIESQAKVLTLPEKISFSHVTFSKESAGKAERYDRAFDKVNGAELYLKLLSKYIDTSKL